MPLSDERKNHIAHLLAQRIFKDKPYKVTCEGSSDNFKNFIDELYFNSEGEIKIDPKQSPKLFAREFKKMPESEKLSPVEACDFLEEMLISLIKHVSREVRLLMIDK